MKTFIYAGLAIGLLSSTSVLAQTYQSTHVQSDTGARTTLTLPRDATDTRDANSNNANARLSRGDRVPQQYEQDRYIVRDWESYNLQSPPTGYHWLRTDANGQYLLVSIASGQIADTVDQRGTPAMDRRDQGGDDRRGDDRRTDGRHDDSRDNASSDSHWSRGGRASDQYRRDDHAVSDWQQRNLRTPQNGYAWVRNDNGQYALVSRATGRIVDVVDQDRYRPDYNWSRGDKLSGGYLDARFTVNDWRDAGLPRPARGYHWVNINGHYMLTSLRTGTIREIRNISH